MPEHRSRRRSVLAAQFMGAGFTFLAELGCITAVGWWLDGKWGTEPWLTVAGAALGMTVALSHLLRSAAAYEAAVKEEQEAESRKHDGND